MREAVGEEPKEAARTIGPPPTDQADVAEIYILGASGGDYWVSWSEDTGHVREISRKPDTIVEDPDPTGWISAAPRPTAPTRCKFRRASGRRGRETCPSCSRPEGSFATATTIRARTRHVRGLRILGYRRPGDQFGVPDSFLVLLGTVNTWDHHESAVCFYASLRRSAPARTEGAVPELCGIVHMDFRETVYFHALGIGRASARLLRLCPYR